MWDLWDVGIFAVAVTLLFSSRLPFHSLIALLSCIVLVSCVISIPYEAFLRVAVITTVYLVRKGRFEILVLLVLLLFCFSHNVNKTYYTLPLIPPFFVHFAEPFPPVVRYTLLICFIFFSLYYLRDALLSSCFVSTLEYFPLTSVNTYWYLRALTFPSYRLYFHFLYHFQPMLLAYPIAMHLSMQQAVCSCIFRYFMLGRLQP